MGISRVSAALREKMDAIAEEHFVLMRDQDHDGAAHCQCELAKEYRQASEAFWESRKTDKQLADAERDWKDDANTLEAVAKESISFQQRLERAEAEIAALRERERWIPVEEKVPEFRVPVQVSGGVAELRIDGWWTYMDGEKRPIHWKVTHWKALSAAPERP